MIARGTSCCVAVDAPLAVPVAVRWHRLLAVQMSPEIFPDVDANNVLTNNSPNNMSTASRASKRGRVRCEHESQPGQYWRVSPEQAEAMIRLGKADWIPEREGYALVVVNPCRFRGESCNLSGAPPAAGRVVYDCGSEIPTAELSKLERLVIERPGEMAEIGRIALEGLMGCGAGARPACTWAGTRITGAMARPVALLPWPNLNDLPADHAA